MRGQHEVQAQFLGSADGGQVSEQPVRVASGVGLGMKIAFGFVLFSFVAVAGTCATCGACISAGGVAAAKQQEERRAKSSAAIRPGGAREDAGAKAQISGIEIKNVTVGKDVLQRKGVFGELKNNSGKTLSEVTLVVYALGKDGAPVWETETRPIGPNIFDPDMAKPLKAGYGRKFSVSMEEAPDEWKGKVEVKVTGALEAKSL